MANTIQLNFTRGEITPFLQSRIDLDHYKAGLKVMQNWIVTRFGGMTRMPGTIYYGEAKNSNRVYRWLPFQFNRAQTYAIEAGHLYFRFWNIFGRVESPPGTPVEVVTPYDEDDLKYIQVRQSGDLVFIFCRGYWPRVLTRNSETSWSLANYVPLDGPYLDINTTATTLDPSAASGSVTITASATTGINGGTGFQTSDIGRPIRFLEAGGEWYWFVITARASTTSITATFMGRDDGNTAAMPGHVASANWRLGAWSEYDGYPAAVGLYEERLVSAGSDLHPTTVWYTVAQDTGLDDYSFQAPLVADDGGSARLTGQLATIQWVADGKDIILGTEGGLRILGRNDESAAFGPTNMRQKPETAVTAAYIPGLFIENVLVFLDVYRGVLYEALYANEAQGYVARELSALNEHLLGYGITSIAYQVRPHKIIWMTTDNGYLLAATYDRDQEVFGVSLCQLGGDGLAEWVMSLPGTTKDGDQVWIAVHRTLAGVEERTVEVLAAFYRDGYSEQAFPIYGHCSGFYDDVATNIVEDLDYIEGDTVGVWGDGVDLGDITIQDGELVLPNDIEAEQIVWGFRYSSRAVTLRLAEFGDGQAGLGRPSITGEVTVDAYQTPILRVGAGELDADDYDNGLDFWRWDGQSEQDPYDAAPLLTRAVHVAVDDSWSNNGVLTVETNSMHPATITAISAEVEGAD